MPPEEQYKNCKFFFLSRWNRVRARKEFSDLHACKLMWFESRLKWVDENYNFFSTILLRWPLNKLRKMPAFIVTKFEIFTFTPSILGWKWNGAERSFDWISGPVKINHGFLVRRLLKIELWTWSLFPFNLRAKNCISWKFMNSI